MCNYLILETEPTLVRELVNTNVSRMLQSPLSNLENAV